jgi:hypothetical protein
MTTAPRFATRSWASNAPAFAVVLPSGQREREVLTGAEFARFMELRALKKIGRIWPDPHGYLLAAIDPETGLSMYCSAEPVTCGQLRRLIEQGGAV